MAKQVWKRLVELGGPIELATTKLIPFVTFAPGGLYVYFETPTDEPVSIFTLQVFLTGVNVPDSAEWIGSATDGQFVGHLYCLKTVPY